MSKNLDKNEDSDIIQQLGHHEGKISETLSKLNSEELEIPDLTSKPKLLQENHPQKEDTSENKSEKNKISIEEAEVCKNEFDCKKCGKSFKDFEGMAAHVCFYIGSNKSSLHISKVFDQSQETVNFKLVAETSANESISASLTSKISSPSCKITEDDFPQSLSFTTSNQLSSLSLNTLKGDSQRRLTSSVVSHKLQSSRRSSPATKTLRSEKEASKRVSTKYPAYVTPPRPIRPSKAFKKDPLNFKNSATKNLFEKHRSSSIASTERSPEIEVPSKIYTNYPVYVTPPRSFPPSHIHNDDSSRRVINPVAVNLFQSPQIYSTELISAFSGNVVIPAPINPDQSPRIYSTETFTHSSGGLVIRPAINLEESPRIYNTETLTHSSERVIFPAPVSFLQSPTYIPHRPSDYSGGVMSSTSVILQSSTVYSNETLTDSPRSSMIPEVVNFVQPPRLYSTKTLTDSSENTMNPTTVNLFQEPRIHGVTTRTISTQTESEEYESPKSLAIASPNPVSSPSNKNKNNIKKGIGSQTISDISPKEKVDHTERESSDNYPTLVKPKNSSPSSDSFSTRFKFAGAARKSFPRSTCSEKETSLGKICKKKYMSFDKPIRKYPSLKTFSKDSIDSKKLGKVNLSQSPQCTSISAGNLTQETESGKSKPLSSEVCKRLSPSFTGRTKDSLGGFVNQEIKGASKSPQSPDTSDEKRSPQTKSAKESYAKSLPFSTPKKGSPNVSEDNSPGKIKKQKYKGDY